MNREPSRFPMTRVLIAQKHYDCSCGSSAAHSAPARAVGCIKQVEFMSHMSHKCPIPGTHDLSGIRYHVLFVQFMSSLHRCLNHVLFVWFISGSGRPTSRQRAIMSSVPVPAFIKINKNKIYQTKINYTIVKWFAEVKGCLS